MFQLSISLEDILGLGVSTESERSPKRKGKGKSIIDFPSDFCIVDLEITGLSTDYDSIIEIGALRYSKGVMLDKFHSLIKHDDLSIPCSITELTGITDDILATAPYPYEVISSFDKFLGGSIVVGYNVNFDINFLYDYYLRYLDKPFTNNFIDLLRIARKLYPELPSHRLSDIVDFLGIYGRKLHRALGDCEVTALCYDSFMATVFSKYHTVSEFQCEFHHKVRAADIQGDILKNDSANPLYKKYCAFTGKLEKFSRKKAMQIVADLGGINQDGVTKDTNFLILGNNDYCSSIVGGKSSKQKKAERYNLEGKDIEIIPETVFYEMIADSLREVDISFSENMGSAKKCKVKICILVMIMVVLFPI